MLGTLFNKKNVTLFKIQLEARMRDKIIAVDQERCTGCRRCEIVCSVIKEGVSDSSRSRIHVRESEIESKYFPILCQHCEEPVCAQVCPTNAIYKQEDSSRVLVDRERCIGCRACISVCPQEGLKFDVVEKKILRCDLCDGDPICVKVCEEGALKYMDRDSFQLEQNRAAIQRLWKKIRTKQDHGI